MARLARVLISQELFQQMVTVGWTTARDGATHTECIEGLPDGAELVNSGYDAVHNVALLTFHHESFADVPIGGMIPVIHIAHKTFYEDARLNQRLDQVEPIFPDNKVLFMRG